MNYRRATILLLLITSASCGKIPGNESSAQKKDPAHCQVIDLGEAADLIKKPAIDDDRMVLIQGLAHPHALVWRDQHTGQTNYITRIMGTEQKLFFMTKVAADETPGVRSEFKGHLIKWDKIPEKRSHPIAGALASQYNINIKPKSTYLIDADSKPSHCP